MSYTVHSTSYTVHRVYYIVHSTKHIIHSTQYSIDAEHEDECEAVDDEAHQDPDPDLGSMETLLAETVIQEE